jgi:methylenetetrahydrofolate dehydrogenase (NADP+)/methenyltetrahydrofolate cyclohydrolase
MSARIIDGKAIAAQVRGELGARVEGLRAGGITPTLAVVLVGDDPASAVYVRNKAKAAHSIGIEDRTLRLPVDTTRGTLIGVVDDLNRDPEVHGILVQLPLPAGLEADSIIARIDPVKDVDAFHPQNVGRIMTGRPRFLPCTPAAVREILRRERIPTAGRHVVIVGRSDIVGRPLANILLWRGADGDATVTVCHSRTPHLEHFTRQAEILVAAVGVPELIRGDMIQEGAVVIDVGVNRVADTTRRRGYRLTGDVLFEEAVEIASAITPVPGGVGPMTIAMLLQNTVTAAED